MKKMNNKGFSLVELIIVIAIMAILAGALAPALIKYIAKSRRSSDANNCGTIQSSMQTAMSDETAEAASPSNGTTWTDLPATAGDAYWSVVDKDLSGGLAAFNSCKTTKLADGTKVSGGKYQYSVDANGGIHVGVKFSTGSTLECVPTLDTNMK